MSIDWDKATAFLADAGERAAKTFAQTFLAACTVTGVATDLHSVPWLAASEAGIVAVVFSTLSSIASLKVGSSGTASLTKAVKLARE
jgi:hypothetical protein